MPLVSVILASRGRPWSLKRSVDSLTQSDSVEVMVGLDEDDPTRHDAAELIIHNAGVEIVVRPRHDTIHQLDNTLAEMASGEFLMLWADDVYIEQPDWIERLKPALDALPKKLGVTFPMDRLYPNFATAPIISKELVEMNGFYVPPWFPFLYGDTWWYEVGVLSGMLIPADISMGLGLNGTDHKLRDLLFWGKVFDKTRPMRAELAGKMLNKVYGEDSTEANYLISTMPERVSALETFMAHQKDPKWLERVEANADQVTWPSYPLVRERAEAFLQGIA